MLLTDDQGLKTMCGRLGEYGFPIEAESPDDCLGRRASPNTGE